MTPSEKLGFMTPTRVAIAFLILAGGIMHLIGLIQVITHNWPLPRIGWGFYLFAILMYPACMVMILKDISLGYWITLAAPSIGGLFIFIGFFWPSTRYLMLLAGTVENEITWYGFVQVVSESMAVAGAVCLISDKIWRRK